MIFQYLSKFNFLYLQPPSPGLSTRGALLLSVLLTSLTSFCPFHQPQTQTYFFFFFLMIQIAISSSWILPSVPSIRVTGQKALHRFFLHLPWQRVSSLKLHVADYALSWIDSLVLTQSIGNLSHDHIKSEFQWNCIGTILSSHHIIVSNTVPGVFWTTHHISLMNEQSISTDKKMKKDCLRQYMPRTMLI